MFPTQFVDKIEKHVLRSGTFFLKSCLLWVNVDKYSRVGQVTDDNMAQCAMYRGADKSLARPGRKQPTATEL